MIRSKKQLAAALLMLAVFALPSARLQAQAVYGSIAGTVFDPSGAAVPNAKVAITDIGRDINYATLTNESGNYGQTHLIIGNYRLRVEAPGFATYIQEGVSVAVDSVTHVDVTLQTGEVTQTIDVKEEVPLLKTERTDVSTTLFLSDPAAYDGGELLIRDAQGERAVKLPAGSMVIYPATTLHGVRPITRGSRWASFFWTQSMIRDEVKRQLLFDLDQSIQKLSEKLSVDDPQVLCLTGGYHNLIRMWAEV